MRWIKLTTALLRAKRRAKLAATEESKINYTVWPTDIDVSIMNHAAMMTVMEMGRIDFIVRSGFLDLARRKKWYFPSASISVQFIRPLKIFQKATVATRILYADDRWIYLEQKMTRAGKAIAVAIVKSTVKKGREHIAVSEIVRELNLGALPAHGKDIVEAYEKENSLMQETLL